MTRFFLLSAVAGLALLGRATDAAITDTIAINSISPAGTNLILDTTFSTGWRQATLESQKSVGAPWVAVAQTVIPTNQSGAIFTISKPADATAFFRLRLDGGDTPESEAVSTALQYVTIDSLATHRDSNGDAIFHFIGRVDGSDSIKITHYGAFWNHVNWDWPQGPVMINGTQWNPQQKNYVTTLGLNIFLPVLFSLDTADLQVIQGRDVVAMERTPDALIVYLDDTPNGADTYEFNVHFHPVTLDSSVKAPSPRAMLELAGSIDGSDRIKITATQAGWLHQAWSPPANVTLNGIPWDPTTEPVRKNEGTNQFLPTGIDLSTARIVSRRGRDLATMWTEKDALWIQFADNPNGADNYDIKISFGN